MAPNLRYMYTLEVRKILSLSALKLNCPHHYSTKLTIMTLNIHPNSKYQTLSVPMHKPTDEYFGGYKKGGGGGRGSKFHFIKIKCQRIRLMI